MANKDKIIEKIEQLHDKESMLCEEVKDMLNEMKEEVVEESESDDWDDEEEFDDDEEKE